jgi:hypothetical protein
MTSAPVSNKPNYMERIAIFSHSTINCKLQAWATACYLAGSELVFYNEADRMCPFCGAEGTLGSYSSVISLSNGFFGDLDMPKPGSVLIIRENSNTWQNSHTA